MAAEAKALNESMDRVALARVLTLMFIMMISFLFAFIRVAPQFKARIALEGFLRRSFCCGDSGGSYNNWHCGFIVV
ncbi:MAG: hypothetical protein CM15mP95_1520 [Alphaproteobacteria bacterium]|nr:MAG: hypothetical protein CM15mP95_1520 [Alphaproteobacteria bacterium]